MHKPLFKLVAQLYFIFFIDALAVVPLCSSPSFRAVAEDGSEEKLRHPVLGIDSHEAIFDKKLDDDSLKRMINLPVPENSRHLWLDAFGKAEATAAGQLCSRLKDLSQPQVLTLLGPPAFKKPQSGYEHHLVLSPDSEPNATWFYLFGGSPKLVTPVFRNGKCVGAIYNDWSYGNKPNIFDSFYIDENDVSLGGQDRFCRAHMPKRPDEIRGDEMRSQWDRH